MPKTKSKSKRHWEMRVAGLAMDPASNVPVVVLRDVDNLHQVPIWIGQVEAMAIATELEGVKHSRPMTHDLLRSTIERLGWTVTRIEIFDLRENTFHARIVLSRGDEEVEVDSRPSDAIALAIRTDAVIRAEDHVVQQARMDVPSEHPEESEGEHDEGGSAVETRARAKAEAASPRPLVGPMPDSDEEWEELLEGLDPNDFGKYKQ